MKPPVLYGVRYLQVYRNSIRAKEDFAKITVMTLTWNAEVDDTTYLELKF